MNRRDPLLPRRACAALPLAAALLLATATADPLATPDDWPDPAVLAERIAWLASPELAGRAAGSPGERAAAEGLASWLAACGAQPAAAGAWLQPIPLAGDSLRGRESVNAAGALPGQGRLAGRWLVVGAHLDHLGPAGADAYFPGANDNAAGVAALAEVAAWLAAAKDAGDRRSVLVVGFGAEEAGLQGSAWLCRHGLVPRDSIDAMLNLDTIGVLADDTLHVGGLGAAAPFAALVAAAAADLPLATSRMGWAGGDHVSFLEAGVPALALFGGPYPEYNTPDDLPGVIDRDDLARVTAFAARLADALRRHDGPLAFTGARPADAAAAGGEQHREAWFGTVPAFGGDAAGYAIGEVVAGGPAARAGLRGGDLLVSLDGAAVTDLGSFTRALRAHAPGAPVEAVVRRGGRELRFTVVVGHRAQRP